MSRRSPSSDGTESPSLILFRDFQKRAMELRESKTPMERVERLSFNDERTLMKFVAIFQQYRAAELVRDDVRLSNLESDIAVLYSRLLKDEALSSESHLFKVYAHAQFLDWICAWSTTHMGSEKIASIMESGNTLFLATESSSGL